MTKQPSVLVTGGAGYVGSHVCKALYRSGLTPVTLDNLSTGHRQAVKWGPLEVGDVRDEAFVSDVMARHKVTAVLHFAALSLVGESAGKPHEYYDSNVGGVIALVAAMRRCGVSRIVFSSTCAVYGMPAKLPIEETESTRPINVYGRTKLAAENFLTDVASTGAIRTVLLRYFNAAGADADGDIGEAHSTETHLVPLAIQAALDLSRPLSVFGSDYPTADGTCERDYVHVEDLAEAHLQALAFLETTGGSRAFNLGSGHPISVRQVLGAVERVLGTKVPTIEAPRRAGDPSRLFAAPGLAERDLGWVATRSDIDSIVASAARWHRSNVFSEAV
ncbi:UDP-glucose 4-epimerase GalE [Dongia deserti]|uniref:UDP-glucose 4-epimerase GalE n=1 Tax=Dongia deserti TaxID=2268030 RepID=UPI000E65E3D6|nr:UDP-glucose 4-epimerase GalE [Dongia deserti]